MNKRTVLAVSLVCVALAAGAVACKRTTPAPSGAVELSIFHTNDMHSHFRSAKIEPFGLGGLARLSTLLKNLRAGRERSLTLDAGDYSEGNWYFAIDTGANILQAMDMMGYDAAALGNHDFLIGPDQLLRTMKDANVSFPVLAANLEMAAYKRGAELRKAVPEYLIKTVGGIKVGIIGLTTYEILYDDYLKPVKILNAIDIATAAAKRMRPYVDVMVIISHNAIDMNQQIARVVPGVDAMISGHSHHKTPVAYFVENAGRSVPIVETGQWGQFLGDLRLTVDVSKKLVKYKGFELHPVTPDLAEDPAMNNFIRKQDELLSQRIGQDVHRPVAQAQFDLIQKDGSESALCNLAVKAYRDAVCADVSLEQVSLTGISIAQGVATMMDVHDVIPHIYDFTTGKEWMLKVWNAKGSDLSLIFNVFYTVNGLVPMGTPIGWLSADGADVIWEPGVKRVPLSQASQRSLDVPAIRSLRINGKPIDPNARYRVALADGLLYAITLANKKLSLGVDLSDVWDSGIEAWQAVVSYAENAGQLTRADLGVGQNVHTQSTDLAMFEYGVSWDGSALELEVENHGLTASVDGTVNCSSGIPNDSIAYKTRIQKYTPIGSVAVPPLAPGETTTVRIPWSIAADQVQGRYPVDCVVTGSGDKYPGNNSMQKVFRSGQVAAAVIPGARPALIPAAPRRMVCAPWF